MSPYYLKNKKGETDYIKEVKYIRNIEIFVEDRKYIIGVHEGTVNGVRLFFLHNPELFPLAYAGEDPRYVMKQITGFAKASLEMFC